MLGCSNLHLPNKESCFSETIMIRILNATKYPQLHRTKAFIVAVHGLHRFFLQPQGCDKSTVLLFYFDVHAAPPPPFNCDGLVMLPRALTVALFGFPCPPLPNKTEMAYIHAFFHLAFS